MIVFATSQVFSALLLGLLLIGDVRVNNPTAMLKNFFVRTGHAKQCYLAITQAEKSLRFLVEDHAEGPNPETDSDEQSELSFAFVPLHLTPCQHFCTLRLRLLRAGHGEPMRWSRSTQPDNRFLIGRLLIPNTCLGCQLLSVASCCPRSVWLQATHVMQAISFARCCSEAFLHCRTCS